MMGQADGIKQDDTGQNPGRCGSRKYILGFRGPFPIAFFPEEADGNSRLSWEAYQNIKKIKKPFEKND